MFLRNDGVVGNDARSPGARCLVISGANAGGKSVLLKTLGLVAVLARLGAPVPCDEGAVVGCFDPILADIGDAQNADGNVSTHVGHLLVAKAALEAADADRAERPLAEETAARDYGDRLAALEDRLRAAEAAAALDAAAGAEDERPPPRRGRAKNVERRGLAPLASADAVAAGDAVVVIRAGVWYAKPAKQGLRSYSTHPLAKRAKPAAHDDGGDAFTRVVLRAAKKGS
ncbi:hypothetical protein JL722_4874 [Aureococcus anophagefferens]|nr:hypothetical protein JL722_4874 [Aureococcus anophagefferens]